MLGRIFDCRVDFSIALVYYRGIEVRGNVDEDYH